MEVERLGRRGHASILLEEDHQRPVQLIVAQQWGERFLDRATDTRLGRIVQ